MSSLSSPGAISANRDTLQNLLGVIDAARFLQDTFGKEMLYVPATTQRFANLFSWDDLNSVLNQGFALYPRARLLKGGATIDPASYTYEISGRQFPDSGPCQKLMAEGATLILEATERVNPRLDSFIDGLRRDFNAEISCGIAATFALVRGLGLHWDPFECFNIQIDGEKEWQLFRPDRTYPLNPTKRFPQRHDIARSLPPTGEPVWAGMMKPGDVLYLPRGWWHTVTPKVVPSLHITIGVDLPTLSDFLAWHAYEATQFDAARRMMPAWEHPDRRRAWTSEALAAVVASLSADTVETYFARISAPPAREFALPTAATPGGPKLNASTHVRIGSTSPLEWSTTNDTIRVIWKGQAHELSAAAAPILERLNQMTSCSVGELCTNAEPILIKAMLLMLLRAGIVIVTTRT